MPKEWDPNEGNDPGLPHPRRSPRVVEPTANPDPVVANGRVVSRRPGPPLKVLNAVSRVVACAVVAVGSLASLATLDWRYVVGGLVLALCVALAGPWVRPS